MIKRVHVVGGPGSGKTTLSQQLGRQLSAPVFDLDDVAYAGGTSRPLSGRNAETRRIADGPVWIAEGIYIWWTGALLQAADVSSGWMSPGEPPPCAS